MRNYKPDNAVAHYFCLYLYLYERNNSSNGNNKARVRDTNYSQWSTATATTATTTAPLYRLSITLGMKRVSLAICCKLLKCALIMMGGRVAINERTNEPNCDDAKCLFWHRL